MSAKNRAGRSLERMFVVDPRRSIDRGEGIVTQACGGSAKLQ